MSLAVVNPRTGEPDYSIEPLSAAAIAALTAKLRSAQTGWAALAPEARSSALRKLAEAMGRHRDALVAALTADTGRAAISVIEVDAMMGALVRWADRAPAIIAAAEVKDRQTGIPTITTSTRLVPYPLVGVISP